MQNEYDLTSAVSVKDSQLDVTSTVAEPVRICSIQGQTGMAIMQCEDALRMSLTHEACRHHTSAGNTECRQDAADQMHEKDTAKSAAIIHLLCMTAMRRRAWSA